MYTDVLSFNVLENLLINLKIKCNFNVPTEKFTYEFHKEQQV